MGGERRLTNRFGRDHVVGATQSVVVESPRDHLKHIVAMHPAHDLPTIAHASAEAQAKRNQQRRQRTARAEDHAEAQHHLTHAKFRSRLRGGFPARAEFGHEAVALAGVFVEAFAGTAYAVEADGRGLNPQCWFLLCVLQPSHQRFGGADSAGEQLRLPLGIPTRAGDGGAGEIDHYVEGFVMTEFAERMHTADAAVE